MAPATKKAGGGRSAKKDAAEQKPAAGAGGLSKFFGGKPAKEEAAAAASPEKPAKASPAPANALKNLFAAQKAAPVPAAAPAAAEAASAVASPARAATPQSPAAAGASPAGKKPQLSEEQLARIEENRRKARERQQAKRTRDETEGPAEEQTPSPPRPPTRPAAAVAAAAAVTPEKVTQHEQRRQSPAPTATVEAVPAGAGRFAAAAVDCKVWSQYNSLYSLRLQQLKKQVLDEARGLWGGMLAPSSFLSEITGYRRSCGASEVVLVGVLFKELKGRLNVIEQYKDVKVVSAIGEASEEETTRRLSTDDDVLWLEDSSMRLKLVVSQEQVAGLPTGMVVGVRGAATEDGHFKVQALCFPRMASPPPLPSPASTEGEGPFLALVSGLAFGSQAEGCEGVAEARARAVAFLLGEGGTGEAVQRLIVCGGTFASGAGTVSKAALQEADETFARLAAAMRVEVMPGRGDPTNLTLPQMPLHPHLFKSVRKCGDFKSVTNPYECSLDGISVLGHSGQPIEDMMRCTSLAEPLEALAICLRASHLAPTAPDTLPTQPFLKSDPFVLEEPPHIFFSGGHASAGHQWHPSARGEGGTLCASVPAFHKKPAVLLVNLRNPRDVRVREFGEQKAEAAKDADVQMGTGEETSKDADVEMGKAEAEPASVAA